MKHTQVGILTAVVFSICQIAGADALLIDGYRNVNPSSYTNWVNAGVAEDISNGAGGTINSGGTVYNINGMTASVSGAGSWSGTFPANGMLNDYLSVNSGTASVSIGGLDTGVTTDGYSTEIYGDMEGNTFTLQADQQYKLYLFGMGDADGQDTTFTFDGVSKTTSSVLAGPEDSHYVTYEFTTGADVSDYSLDFTFSNNTAQYAAFNGLALVAIPEPATLGLITAFGGGLCIIRRRFMI